MGINEPDSKKRSAYLAQYYITAVLLILLLIFNIFIWQILKYQLDRSAEKTEAEKIQIITNSIRGYLHEYEEAAIFGSIYLNAHNASHKSFNNFFEGVFKTHGKEAQAISSILYIEKVTDLEGFKRTMTKNEELPLEDRAFYKISPYESNPAYIVKYIHPYEANHDLNGYNAATDSEQLTAVERSAASGDLAATRKRAFINEEKIVIYKPVYAGIGSTDLKGFIAVLIDPKKLFADLEKEAGKTPIAVYEGKYKLSDLKNDKLYFESRVNPLKGLLKTKVNDLVKHIFIADQPLTFIFTTPVKPQLPKEQQILLNILLHGGSGIIFILFVIVNLLIITVNKSKNTAVQPKTQT